MRIENLKYILIIFLISLFCHFSWFYFNNNIFQSDSYSYLNTADSLYNGKGFKIKDNNNWHETAFRTPGYPMFIAFLKIFNKKNISIIIVQKLLYIIFSIIIFLYGIYRLKLSKNIMLISCIILNLDVATLSTVNYILTETLFSLFLLIMFFLFSEFLLTKKMTFIVLSGIVCGILPLIRPISIFLFVPLFIFILVKFYKSNNLKNNIISFLIFSLIFPSIWIYRNYRVFNKIGLSSISGVNILYYRAAGTIMFKNRISLNEAQNSLKNEVGHIVFSEQKKLKRKLNEFEINSIYQKKGLEILLNDPLNTIKTAFYGFLKLLLGPAYAKELKIFGSPIIGKIIQYLISISWIILTFNGILVWKKNNNKDILILMIIIISYFIFMSMGMEANSRFRVPIMPYFSILSAISINKFFLKTN